MVFNKSKSKVFKSFMDFFVVNIYGEGLESMLGKEIRKINLCRFRFWLLYIYFEIIV